LFYSIWNTKKNIEVGDGTLVCVIEDGGVVESTSKTIPILLQAMDVTIYPEGGDLIENLECGVYIEAFTPYGDPADLSGDIIDNIDGSIVGTIQTKHEGRGKTYFTPKSNKNYSLSITKPFGITKKIEFPKIISEGVTLCSLLEVYQPDEPVNFKISVSKKGVYYIILFKKEVEITCLKINFTEDNSTKEVSLSLPSSNTLSNGVLRATIYDSTKTKAFAERLIFRKQTQKN